MNNGYVPTDNRTFANHLESACANYSMISDMPHADCGEAH